MKLEDYMTHFAFINYMKIYCVGVDGNEVYFIDTENNNEEYTLTELNKILWN